MVHIRMPGITVWLKTEDNPQLSLWQYELEVATNRINRDTSSILFLEKYLYEVTHRVLSCLSPKPQAEKDLLWSCLCTHIIYIYGLPWAQTVKNPPAMWETWVRSLGKEDPLEKGMAIHSSILTWRIPWTEELGRLQFMGSQKVRHNWTTNTFTSYTYIYIYVYI